MKIRAKLCILTLFCLLSVCACGLRDNPETPVAETESYPVAVAEIYEMELPGPMYNIDCHAINGAWLYLAKRNYDRENNTYGFQTLLNGIYDTYDPAVRIREQNVQLLALIPDRDGKCILFGKSLDETNPAFFLHEYDREGTLQRQREYSAAQLHDLGDALTDGLITEDGRLYLYTYGGDGTVLSFDAEGNPAEVYTPALESLEGIAAGRDGKVYGYYLTGEEPLFAELGSDGEPVVCPVLPNRVFSGYEDGLYLSTGAEFWQYIPETGETNVLWGWDDDYIQLDGNELDQVFCGKDALYLLLYDQSERSSKITEPLTIARVTIQDSRDYPAKQIVTLGTVFDFNINTHVRELVRLYNQQSKDYRVELVTYEQPENSSTADAFSALELQLMRGEGPDLMELTGLYADSLVSQGAFEELDSYYRSSDRIQEDELLDSVREAGTIRGQNILVIPSFGIRSLISKVEIDPQQWTPQYFLELAKNEQLFQFPSGNYALSYCMGIRCGEHFINYEKKECYFDSQEFISLLEQCAKLESVEIPLTYTVPPLKEADYLMREASMSSTADYLSTAYQNGNIYWIGRPGWEGMENEMYPDEAFAMNSASSNKEGAWDFLEFLLSRELQERIDWGFPSRKDCFETYLHNSYYTENYRSEDFGLTISFPEARELTEEEFDMIRSLADTAVFQSWGSNGNPVRTIIMEEANMYFSGDATIEETVKKIQSRVSLYLQES